MLHIAKYLHNRFWWSVGWLIILLAIFTSALRLFLPNLDLTFYRDEIQQIVEERAGMPVRIGSMNMGLQGAHLVLQFSDVSLLDQQTETPRLYMRQVQTEVKLLDTLIDGKLILGGAMVTGTSLRVIRRWDDTWVVNGFKEAADGSQGSILDAFLRRTHLRVHDSNIYWLDEKSEQPPMHFSQVNVDLLNTDDRHKLAATLRLGDDSEELIQLAADLREGRQNPFAMTGRIHLKTKGVGLAGRLGALLAQGLTVANGQLDLELWGELREGRLSALQGRTEMHNLQLESSKTPAFSLDHLASEFDWLRSEHGWRVDLDHLVLVHDRKLWPPGRLSIARQETPEGQVDLRLGADYLGLKGLSHLIAMVSPVDSDLQQTLNGLSPDGHLTRLRLAHTQVGSAAPRWRVSGSVSHYHHQPWQRIPGLSGLSLNFDGDQDGGTLLLVSKQFKTEMPWLFREPLSAKKLDGYFKWRFSPQDGLHLQTTDLSMSTNHVQTFSRLDLQLPLNGASPFIDMQTDFWDGDGSQKSRYLPAGIMSKPLVNWLDRAFVAGYVKAGSMLLYGPLKGFPYQAHEGRFEVLFGIEDLVLDYLPGWPRLEEAIAEAHFLNNSLSIKLSDGKMLESRLRQANAQIRQLKGGSPVELSSVVEGPLSDVMRLLAETPLRQRFERFTSVVSASGQNTTRLKLQIPLKKTDHLAISGQLELHKAALQLKESALQAVALEGLLRFDKEKVTGSGIKAQLLGKPVVLEVASRNLLEGKGTRLSTQMEADAGWLQAHVPGVATDYLEGRTQARVVLDIAHESSDTPVRLAIHSDLRGMAVSLPAPLGKPAKTAREIDVALNFRQGGMTDLRIGYDGLLSGWLRDEGQGYRRGDIHLGPGELQLPATPLIRLRGKLQALDTDAWSRWIGGERMPREDRQPASLSLDLQVAELGIAGIICANSRFKAATKTDGWQFSIDSEELKGSFTLPRDLQKQPLVGHLPYLKLKSADLAGHGGEAGAGKPTVSKLDPRHLPALDLRIDSLELNGRSFGKALLQWKKSPHGIQITHMGIAGEGINIDGQGLWWMMGGRHTTKLTLKGHVDSLGELQAGLGWQLGIAEAPLDFEGRLTWPQGPNELSVEKLSGDLKLKVGAGEVTEVDPGVGRLVGLLSLHALGKRLLLDFSDLFAKGLEFDRIEGSFSLNDGDAYTADLEIDGPAARIEITGRTGLGAQDYDQLVTVTPRVSSTLPIVGALAVNPTVGVALVVAQQLFGKQVDRITRTQYELSGSWHDPVIKKRKLEAAERDSSQMPDLPAGP